MGTDICGGYYILSRKELEARERERKEVTRKFLERKLGMLAKCYYLSHGRQYCFMDLNAKASAELLLTGKVVLHGRWYFAA